LFVKIFEIQNGELNFLSLEVRERNKALNQVGPDSISNGRHPELSAWASQT
jgi:hypothetical protein